MRARRVVIRAGLACAVVCGALGCAGQPGSPPAAQGQESPFPSAAETQPAVVEEQPATQAPAHSLFPPSAVPQPAPQSGEEPLIPPAAIVPPPQPPVLPRVPTADVFMFDDFSCASFSDFEAHGWKARTAAGAPGIKGASWNQGGVGFVEDPARPGNRLMRLTATIGPYVTQTEVCQQRKYLEGTYAARVRLIRSSAEIEESGGPTGGDVFNEEVVESFHAATPFAAALDPDRSVIDVEYLPLGGWGIAAGTVTTASWDTRSLEPWKAKNALDQLPGVLPGWHILVIQVSEGEIRYFVDGALTAVHDGSDFPDAPMSIDFSLWFIDNGRPRTQDLRTYVEDVDWVFHAKDVVMGSTDVMKQVDDLRARGIAFRDNVPQENPPLDCPCDR